MSTLCTHLLNTVGMAKHMLIKNTIIYLYKDFLDGETKHPVAELSI